MRPVTASQTSSAPEIHNSLLLVGEVRDTYEPYSLKDMRISPNISTDHIRNYGLIADWLMNMLDASEYVIETNKAMVDSFKKAPPLKSTSRKHPDLCIYRKYPDEKRRTIIQIEVHSGDFNMSLRKLVALGLMDQLRVQRCVNDQIFSCCGFYFPANDTQKTVVKVTLTWSDDAHIFKCIAEPIPLREVSNAINTAITQVVKTLDFQTTQNNFAIPMSKSYIKNHFGDGAEQHSSGQSVVIINMSEQKVYKHPLHEKEGFRLLQLKDSPTINQCLLSHRKTVCVSPYLVVYFIYDLLHPPILLVDAKRYIVSLTSTVIKAIQSLRNCPSRH